MFEKIKKWYKMGLWKEFMVREAVEKGVITEYEYSVIISEKQL